MQKVILLGDSIRMIGYGSRVAEALAPDFTVWQPDDNCRFASYLLRRIWDWQDEIYGADVVHFNCGLWDCCDIFGDGTFTDLQDYARTVLRIGRVLREKCGKVIFATTTPVKPGGLNPPEHVARYNMAVVPGLREIGVTVNDLHACVAPHLDTYVNDTDFIHLTEAGAEACARQTVEVIRRVAATQQ